jgi:hypothetical protein
VTGSLIDPTCIFCQIVAGDADATLLYEDDTLIVFLDINPVTPGHTLVVPRAHMPALSDVDPRTVLTCSTSPNKWRRHCELRTFAATASTFSTSTAKPPKRCSTLIST